MSDEMRDRVAHAAPVARWCDGSAHSPNAIPPLPLHDWRFDGDDPWVVCARCNERRRT